MRMAPAGFLDFPSGFLLWSTSPSASHPNKSLPSAGEHDHCRTQREEHHRTEPHCAHAGNPGDQRPSQAGSDFQDPSGAKRKGRPHLRGRRAGNPSRRLRLPALARLQLSARAGRHLRFAVADTQVRPENRRLDQRQRAPAARRREILRAGQDRGHQLRVARGDAQQDPLRQPDAALSAGTHQDGDRAREPSAAASWIC